MQCPPKAGLLPLTALLLSACGGGAASAPTAVPPPPPVFADPVPDLSAVAAEVERHPVADMALIVGDADGELLRYEKGAFSVSEPVRLASASKLLTGLAVWSLMERGVLAESDRVGDRVRVWNAGDARAEVTLEQLMSFTSGLNTSPSGETCAGRMALSLEACVEIIHDGELDTAPGSTFFYGPDHMQVAAWMAETVTGEPLSETLRANILDPAGAGAETGFLRGPNARYSGSAQALPSDYALVLRAPLAGELVEDVQGFTRVRTEGAAVGYQPVELDRAGLDWRYGFGFWVECGTVPFDPDCATDPVISSAGARGTVPWVDFEAGYWAIIAMDETRPSVSSSELQAVLQPMIRDPLAR